MEIAPIDIAVNSVKNGILVSWMIAAECCQQEELLLRRPVDYIFINIPHEAIKSDKANINCLLCQIILGAVVAGGEVVRKEKEDDIYRYRN